MTPEDETPEALPHSLVEAIRTADRALPLITARVDRKLAAQARAHFAGRRQAAWRVRPAWWAAAASLVVAVLVVQWQDSGTPGHGAVYADIDRSGRIDIADVLALARSGKGGERQQAELDAFAMRIVSLKAARDAS
jgi:hypothetical protein